MIHRAPFAPLLSVMALAAAFLSSGCDIPGPLLGPSNLKIQQVAIEYVRLDPNDTSRVVGSGTSYPFVTVYEEVQAKTGDLIYVRTVLNGTTVTRQSSWSSFNPDLLRMEAVQDIDPMQVGSNAAWMPVTAVAAGVTALTAFYLDDPDGVFTKGADLHIRIADK
jgi:hypothetical protein